MPKKYHAKPIISNGSQAPIGKLTLSGYEKHKFQKPHGKVEIDYLDTIATDDENLDSYKQTERHMLFPRENKGPDSDNNLMLVPIKIVNWYKVKSIMSSISG